MKRLFSLAAAALMLGLAAPHAQAQGGGGPPGGGRGMGQMLMQGITLTDAQKAKVDSIQASFREQMRGQMGNAGGGPPDEASMAKRREMMGKMQAAIRATLTPEQQKVFDKNAAEMAARRPGE